MSKEIIKHFPFLHDMEYKEFDFQPAKHNSLAAALVVANLPYKAGVYFVFNCSNFQINNLLYVGIAGADKNGVLNTHQIPKRLLAVTYPPQKYSKIMPSLHTTRNEAWPLMMKMDKISIIKICCFFSPINDDYKVHKSKIPLKLEKSINKILKEKKIKQPWSKKHA